MTGIVFDLDGTLVDSAPAIRDIANVLMAELSLPALDVDETRGYIGHGAAVFLEKALAARGAYDERAFAEPLDRFQALYADAPGDANIPMPGVEAAMRELSEAGARLAVCTNKPMAPTKAVLSAMGWGDLIDAVVAGDSLPERKPHPAPLLEAARLLGRKPVIYVGDSEVDAATAAAAGIPFYFYMGGYSKVPVAELQVTETFSDMKDLPALILAGVR